MRILIVNPGMIPVKFYGGTERVIWSLGKELVKLGHEVMYLVKNGSYCEFASVIHIDDDRSIMEQIPDNIDIIHFNFRPRNIELIKLPYIITLHENSNDLNELCELRVENNIIVDN